MPASRSSLPFSSRRRAACVALIALHKAMSLSCDVRSKNTWTTELAKRLYTSILWDLKPMSMADGLPQTDAWPDLGVGLDSFRCSDPETVTPRESSLAQSRAADLLLIS